MSEFRRFCIGAFILAGLSAAIDNHMGGGPKSGSAEAILTTIAMLLFGGVIAVAVFGKRS